MSLNVEFVLTTEQPDGGTDTDTVRYPMTSIPRVGENIVYADGSFEVVAVDWQLGEQGVRVEVIGYRKIDTGEGERLLVPV